MPLLAANLADVETDRHETSREREHHSWEPHIRPGQRLLVKRRWIPQHPRSVPAECGQQELDSVLLESRVLRRCPTSDGTGRYGRACP